MQYQEDDTPDTCDGDVFAVFTPSQAQAAQPPITAKSDDSIQTKDSQHFPITISKRGTPIPNPSKDNSISKDSTKDKSVSASLTTFNFSAPINSSTPASKTSAPNVLSSQNENQNQYLMNSFQSFDILDHARKTKIQMSEVEFLRSNLDQFDRLVKFVKEKDTSSNLPNSNSLQNNLVTFPSPVEKIEPFYISLLINGYKLSNCVINSGASDNVMPSKVVNALGLTLTKTFGRYFSMDNKQVPLIGQIKDAQFSFAAFPEKKIKMTILVADVPTSYYWE